MSTYTRRRSPQREYMMTGQRQDSIFRQSQQGVVCGRRTDEVDCPFPNKPVGHRRPSKARTQNSFDLHDLEKMTIRKQPGGPFLPQKHDLNGTRETTGPQHQHKDTHRGTSGEVQMDKAIHDRKLILQGKLWMLEEKIKHKIERDSAEAAAGDDKRKHVERKGRGKEPSTKWETEVPVGADQKIRRESSLPPISNPSHFSKHEEEELGVMAGTDANVQHLACQICNRNFRSERLEKHMQICKKVKQSQRRVFDSYLNRTKGSAIEEFWKTHSRSKTPERKNQRQNDKTKIRNVPQGRLPAGATQPKRSK